MFGVDRCSSFELKRLIIVCRLLGHEQIVQCRDRWAKKEYEWFSVSGEKASAGSKHGNAAASMLQSHASYSWNH
jgi:hypothetical protein